MQEVLSVEYLSEASGSEPEWDITRRCKSSVVTSQHRKPSSHSVLHTTHLQLTAQPGLQQRSSTHVVPDATCDQAL
eukprot:jgi/Astpho2/9036/Aster-02698